MTAGGDWGARAAAYDGLRLLLWQAGRDAAPSLAAEAGALLPLLAEHLGGLTACFKIDFKYKDGGQILFDHQARDTNLTPARKEAGQAAAAEVLPDGGCHHDAGSPHVQVARTAAGARSTATATCSYFIRIPSPMSAV